VERFNAELEAIKEANAQDSEEHERFKEETVEQIDSLKGTSQKGKFFGVFFFEVSRRKGWRT
jgi:hypothetical protein